MPTVTLTMIVRNEEANLPACLASCADLFNELVIVDTGSIDRTKEIAAAARDKHGQPARVFDFAWCDDFAAARNESLRHATGDWIFVLDADDRLSPVAARQLRSLFPTLEPQGECTLVSVSVDSTNDRAFGAPQIRLFSRMPLRSWTGRIHEQLTPIIGVRETEIPIHHFGATSPESFARKAVRNIPLLEAERRDHPEKTELLFYLGRELGAIGRFDDALCHYQECRRRLDACCERPHYYAILRLQIGYWLGVLGRWRELERIEEEARDSATQDDAVILSELSRLFPGRPRADVGLGTSVIVGCS